MRKKRIACVLMLSLGGAAQASAVPPVTHSETALLALARAERIEGHRIQALAHCQELLARWPGNEAARRLNIQLLSELGAATRAQKLAAALPQLDETEAARATLLANEGAHETRWAKAEPDDLRHPYAEADKAVADISRVADDTRLPQPLRLRASFDRLVAWEEAGRAAEVLKAYASLQRQHVELPPYAERAVAAAMMQQHQPRAAIAAYEDSIRRDPGPYDLSEADPRIGLAYAYMDVGQARKALAIIDRLAASEPRWLRLRDVRGAVQNQRKVDADGAAAALRGEADLLVDADARSAALSDEAPGNAELLRGLAMAELARGWPRRALDTLRMADTLDQHDVGGMLDKAEAFQHLHDYAEAQAQLDQAKQYAARDSLVRDAEDAWQRERGWQFDITHDQGRGNSPDYGDRDWETQATLASPLIDQHWRVLAIMRTAAAALPEGDASRDRAGVGVQGYLPGAMFYLQALPAWDRFARRTAFEAGFTWAIDDHWSVASDWSSAGADVPLRAQYYGITAKTFDASVRWRQSELTSAGLAVNQDRFSDGNLRKGWLADVAQRLYTGPNIAFDGGVQLGGSTNTETNRPYFNPRWDRTYALTGSLKNLLNQNYDRLWKERFDFAIGQYAERGYATGWMASMHYGQTFQPRAGLRFGWGLGWFWQPYDGRHESRVVLDLTMHWGE